MFDTGPSSLSKEQKILLACLPWTPGRSPEHRSVQMRWILALMNVKGRPVAATIPSVKQSSGSSKFVCQLRDLPQDLLGSRQSTVLLPRSLSSAPCRAEAPAVTGICTHGHHRPNRAWVSRCPEMQREPLRAGPSMAPLLFWRLAS